MEKVRRRIFEIVQTAEVGDKWSRLFDYFILVSIGISVVISFATTFRLSPVVASSCRICEIAIVLIFTVEYLLRLLTADFIFPKDGPYQMPITFHPHSNGDCRPISHLAILSALPVPWVAVILTSIKGGSPYAS